MPDVLDGHYANGAMFDGTPEAPTRLQAYIKGAGQPDSERQSAQISGALAELKKQGYKSVGTVGFCWGWKAIISAKDVNQFSAVAACHPSFISKGDENAVDVPVCLLPSGGEDKATVDAVYEGLEKKNPGKNFIKYFPDQAHGWAAARGNVSGVAERQGERAVADSVHSSRAAPRPRRTRRPTTSSPASSRSTSFRRVR